MPASTVTIVPASRGRAVDLSGCGPGGGGDVAQLGQQGVEGAGMALVHGLVG